MNAEFIEVLGKLVMSGHQPLEFSENRLRCPFCFHEPGWGHNPSCTWREFIDRARKVLRDERVKPI
jgi:hypothetical protein